MTKKSSQRVFLISNMYPSSYNVRFGIFVKRCFESLSKKFEVKRIVLTRKDDTISKILGYSMLYLKVVRLYFVVSKKDLVYVHFPIYFSFFLIPLVWKGIPLILNFHGNDIILDTGLKKLLFKPLYYVVNKSDKIIVPSNYYKGKIAKIFNISECKCFVYPSGGVDSNIFYPREKKNDKLVFGFVSYFIYKKGWWIFLQALAILKEKKDFPPFKGIIVGDGPDKEKILTNIKSKNLNVSLISSVSQEKLSEIYAEFSAFIFPTYREEESLGLVGIESLMCGIPVITCKVGGPMGYIKDGFNGFFFEMKDCEDLARKMIDYERLNEEELSELRENCSSSAKVYESSRVEKGLLDVVCRISQKNIA